MMNRLASMYSNFSSLTRRSFRRQSIGLLLVSLWIISTTTTTAEDAPSLLRSSSGSNNSQSRHQASSKHHAKIPPQQVFLDWCQKVMGISTTYLMVQNFDYYDYSKALAERTDQFSEDLWEKRRQPVLPTIPWLKFKDWPRLKILKAANF